MLCYAVFMLLCRVGEVACRSTLDLAGTCIRCIGFSLNELDLQTDADLLYSSFYVGVSEDEKAKRQKHRCAGVIKNGVTRP